MRNGTSELKQLFSRIQEQDAADDPPMTPAGTSNHSRLLCPRRSFDWASPAR
jgi:hypothetical protein